MNASCSRSLSGVCEVCTSKMQSVADMLLLSCSVKPVWTDTIIAIQTNELRDQIISTMTNISTLSQNLVSHVHMISAKWTDISTTLQELTSAVNQFIEITSHIAYIISVNFSNCSEAENGLVDKYSVCYSGLEIKLSCSRLKRTRADDLSPQIIIDLCSNISKHISVITDICRKAGHSVNDESVEDQFKLSVKSVTCAAGCLIASIKSYKSSPNLTHHSRVMVFCEPVLTSSQALVSFATEKDFIGAEGVLTVQAKEIQKKILGACMNIVSSCIQLCKTIRDLTYDMMTTHHRERLRSCTESIDHGSGRLLKILEGYDINKLFKDHREKHAHSQEWRESSPTGKSEISDTSTVDTHISNNCNNSERESESSSNHGNIEYSPDHDDNSTSFSSSENSSHSVASR